ncbi:hypothetical protein GCM10027290_28510 [Micromonospora sonneratiae]|uniref:CopC domain-containing protein n=1 Tax=Micromonospora sonneratiae TaxID=1184706 RepID=A0ABW3Y9I7_9ACTN
MRLLRIVPAFVAGLALTGPAMVGGPPAAGSAAPYPPPPPVLLVNPVTATPGATTTLVVVGFGADETVDIVVTRALNLRATTDANGRLETRFQPEQLGTFTLVATGRRSGRTATARLTVIRTPSSSAGGIPGEQLRTGLAAVSAGSVLLMLALARRRRRIRALPESSSPGPVRPGPGDRMGGGGHRRTVD